LRGNKESSRKKIKEKGRREGNEGKKERKRLICDKLVSLKLYRKLNILRS